MREPTEAQEFWIAYDYQAGKWCVEDKPMTVVRPGMEVFHVREVAALSLTEPSPKSDLRGRLERRAAIHVNGFTQKLLWTEGDASLDREAAARIAELEAERDALEADLSVRTNQFRYVAKSQADNFNRATAAEAKVTELEATVAELRGALRGMFCPRPCNGRPDPFDVSDCFDAGECGCIAGAALQPKEPDSHE